jgi:carboxylesterase
VLRFLLRLAAGFVILAVALVAAVYLWPLDDDTLRHADRTTSGYAAAVADIDRVVGAEKAIRNLRPECGSRVYTHGQRTEKAVLLLHGYTACPDQFDPVAKQFFDHGYNVYLPRLPRHGTTQDATAYSDLTDGELIRFANSALTDTTGLGADVGVVGMSGGAVLATWLADYRPDVVTHLEVLSPFYRPAPSQAPGWKVKPLEVLYGSRLLPDVFTAPNRQGFSYYGLSQFLKIVANYPSRQPDSKLRTLALVTSPNDDQVDLGRAASLVGSIAKANPGAHYTYYQIDPAWKIGHDTVGQQDLLGHGPDLYPVYLALYEGTAG